MTPRPDRLSELLAAVEATCLTVEKLDDVRLQLDPYAISDVTKENFKPPAARIFLLRSAFEASPDARCDLKVTLAVAVIAGRTGRPDPKMASADMGATALALDVATAINESPYFGLTRLTAAELESFTPALSEKSNDKGLAITLVQFSVTLLGVIPARGSVAAVVNPGTITATGLTLNEQALDAAGDPP